MNQIASHAQLRLSFIRWALFIVPTIMFLGFLSGVVSGSGEENTWFQLLEKPSFQPPGYLFGIVWTILYFMMGFSFALILSARGAKLQVMAICLFIVQLLLNLSWSPVFFGQQQVSTALYIIILLWFFIVATIYVFSKIRALAAWLLVPYLLWVSFASILNYQINVLNPDAANLYARAATADIINE